MAIGLMGAPAARAATITVGTLNDSSGLGGCSLRDAITTANGTNVPGSGCPSPTADPSNTISFSLSGTITLARTLPAITSNLSITRPTGSPRVEIDGGNLYQVMIVRANAVVNLHNLEIAHGNRTSVLGNSGGIENDGTLTVIDSAVFANSAPGKGRSAGGIFNGKGATLTVINSAFVSNLAGVASGGGIFNRGTLTVTNSGFSRNSADVAGGGGGIENDDDGTLTVTDTTFSRNSGGGGGGIFNSGTLTVANSTFSANIARAGGGGIFNRRRLTVTNSTFSANSAIGPAKEAGGGGIENAGALTVTNSTFSGNRATSPGGVGGGGILNHRNATLKGTILAGSSSGGSCAGNAITDAGYNISDDNSCAFSAVGSKNNTDPKLAAAGLARNGGRTDTIALQPDSPAVDAIPFASCTDQATPAPDSLTIDQRGFGRPDPGDSPAACDIGAYESGAVPPPAGCSQAKASAPTLWPPNHKFVAESVLGVTDVKITGIHQDEPVADATGADASGVGGSLAQVRAERDASGDGRVYHLQFTATDMLTNTACSGEVEVCVPHDRAHRACGDGGALYDSTMGRTCAHSQARCSQ